MTNKTANLLCAASVLALGIYIAVLYPRLPDPLPTHWNAAGEVDDYMSRSAGLILFVAIPIISMLLFKLIPVISPHGFRTEGFSRVVNLLMVGTVLFACVVAAIALSAAVGSSVNISVVIPAAVGLLLMFIGNLLGKVRKNFFIGIRTPWTLASDEVWARTHRLGGWCVVLAGLIMFVAALAGARLYVSVTAVVVLVLVPVVYSFFIYRSVEGFGPDEESD